MDLAKMIVAQTKFLLTKCWAEVSERKKTTTKTNCQTNKFYSKQNQIKIIHSCTVCGVGSV
jgi:hypothetical protein